jgi:hypothetical protein
MPHPSHSSRFNHLQNSGWGEQYDSLSKHKLIPTTALTNWFL